MMISQSAQTTEMIRPFDLSRLGDYDYYSKNLLKIIGDTGLIDFDFNSRYVQREINRKWKHLEYSKKPVLLIILKARRHGVSTYVQSRMFHSCHTRSHVQGITIAADDAGSEYIHGMAQTFYEYLPSKLKPKTKHKTKSRLVFDLPKTELDKLGGVNIGLKSVMKTVSCNEKAGLGTGNHFIHFSEYAMYRDAESVRKAVIPTAFNIPGTFVVIESTANGMSGPGEAFYDEWKRAEMGDSVFTPLFYSWLDHEGYSTKLENYREREEIIDTLTDEERELINEHKATYEQIKWRRNQIRFLGDFGGDVKSGLENFHEQYPTTPEEAFIVSGNNVFDREMIKKYKKGCKDPNWIGHIDGNNLYRDSAGNLKIWEMPIDGEKYVISIDPSSGEPGSTDYGCMEVFRVLDRRKGQVAVQVAEWHGKVDSELLGSYAIVLGYKYNTALLAPEVFGYGHAVLSTILRFDYWNVIKRPTLDVLARTSDKKFGWKTDSTTKPSMLTLGRYCVNEQMVILNSEALVDEMMIFVRDSDGPGASAYGRGKDDRVMAFLIALKAIEIEYSDTNVDSMGVLQPKVLQQTWKKDPLKYDDFFDKKQGGSKNWMDL